MPEHICQQSCHHSCLSQTSTLEAWRSLDTAPASCECHIRRGSTQTGTRKFTHLVRHRGVHGLLLRLLLLLRQQLLLLLHVRCLQLLRLLLLLRRQQLLLLRRRQLLVLLPRVLRLHVLLLVVRRLQLLLVVLLVGQLLLLLRVVLLLRRLKHRLGRLLLLLLSLPLLLEFLLHRRLVRRQAGIGHRGGGVRLCHDVRDVQRAAVLVAQGVRRVHLLQQ